MNHRVGCVFPVVALLGVAGPCCLGGENPGERRFWGGLEGGSFDVGPWLRFNGEGYEPAGVPGALDIAVFDVDFVYPPSAAGVTNIAYALTVPREVELFGMEVGDIVAIPPGSDPAPIDLGAAGLRIGLGPDRGGQLFSPGVVRSAGPVVVGGPASAANGRPALVMFTGSRLHAASGVDLIANGLIDGAGVIEGEVRNGGRLAVFDERAASLLIRGNYGQERPGTGSPFGGVLEVEIAGPSENNDVMVVEGHARLGGTLLVNLLDGYEPAPGQLDASIITATSLEGRFDLVFFSPTLSSNLRLRVNYPESLPGATAGRGGERAFQSVRVTAEPLPPQPEIGDGGDGAAPIPGRPSRATAADLNGDGFVDVAAVIPLSEAAGGAGLGVTPGQLLVILNLGVNPGGGWRGFADAVVVTAPSGSAFSPVDIAAGDVDGDGDRDLVVITRGSPVMAGTAGPGELLVYLNDGAGGFALFPTAYPAGDDPRGVALGDFIADPDGELEAAVTSLSQLGTGQLVVFGNTIDERRAWNGWGTTQTSPLPTDDPGTISPGGLDNPKDIDDLAIGSGPGSTGSGGGGGTMHVLLNNDLATLERGGPVFQPAIAVAVGADPRNLTVRDVDGDGDQDIVTSNAGDGTVSIVRNDLALTQGESGSGAGGSGGFVVQSLPIGTSPWTVGAFDFDSDSDTDIAAVVRQPMDRGHGTLIQVLRNDTPIAPARGAGAGVGGAGGLVFSRGATIDFGTNPLYLIPGDVDNDGDVDVIAFVEPDGAPSRLAVAFVNAVCPTDLDGSGATDMTDLCGFLWLYGGVVEPGSAGDFNLDGAIDTRDLMRLLGRFGSVCQ